jgi:hypothetical protein
MISRSDAARLPLKRPIIMESSAALQIISAVKSRELPITKRLVSPQGIFVGVSAELTKKLSPFLRRHY